MSLERGGHREQAMSRRGQLPIPKPPERRESLGRVIAASSQSSRKSSRSGPPSTEDLHTPATPPIPAQLWPLTSDASPRIPSMKSDDIKSQVNGHKYAGVNARVGVQSAPANRPQPRKQERPVIRTKGLIRNFSEPASSESPRTGKNDIVRMANGVRNLPAKPPTMHHAPTFPMYPKPSKSGLRMPSGFESIPRGRGASVTSPNAKSSLAPTQLSRPSTAGGRPGLRPTGKRRPSEKTMGLDGAPPFPTVPKIPQRPWQANYNNEEIRSSFRSALTTTSSHLDTTSTERSSVVTRGTSITESTADVQSRPGSKAGEMTVDDAIDMYLAGFADDDEPDTSESRDTSISEEERRRSMKIAEAVNENMGGSITPSRPATEESSTSPVIDLNEASKTKDTLIPGLSSATSSRDQYGFLKTSHHISIVQYDAWNAVYSVDQKRRKQKWNAYMRDLGLTTHHPIRFPNWSTKTERFIRKGIPPAYRGAAWFFYAGGEAYLKQHAGLYSHLVTRSEETLPDNDKEAIERDLHRTFPDNIHFKPDSHRSDPSATEPAILGSLRRVLRAFAFHSPRIGYCQSLNFLTGLLLLFLAEEKAFWMLHIVTTVYLPGTHELSLEGANIDLWVLMVALRSTMPNIWNKVGADGTPGNGLDSSARLPPISLCTTSWFMSLFIGTLPIESVLRVWDVLFYEGSRTLFRVALSIFKLGEQRIKAVGDSMELFQVVQGLPRGMLDAGALMLAVCRRGGISSDWIEARRKERREWYARERKPTLGSSVHEGGARDEYFPSPPKGDGPSLRIDMEALKRKESMWARVKRKGSVPERWRSPLSSPREGVSAQGRWLLAI